MDKEFDLKDYRKYFSADNKEISDERKIKGREQVIVNEFLHKTYRVKKRTGKTFENTNNLFSKATAIITKTTSNNFVGFFI